MNLAAILPSFPRIGFQQPQARPQHPAATRRAYERRAMPRHLVMTLENRPLRLYVVRGCVWITRDGCAKDTVLGAGEFFEQQPGAQVLVQALEETELVIADEEPCIPHNA